MKFWLWLKRWIDGEIVWCSTCGFFLGVVRRHPGTCAQCGGKTWHS